MLNVERRHVIRDLHRRGWSISAIARRTGHDRRTIRKVIAEPLLRTPKERKARPRKLDPYVDRLKQADAVIVMGCGGAVQITRQVTEELGRSIPVKTALDSVGHMDTLVSGELGSRIMAAKLKGHTIRKIFGAVLLIFVIKLFQKVIL